MKKDNRFLLYIIGALLIISVVLLLVFYLPICVVTFDTGGGTIYPSLNVRINGTVEKPEDPVMDGYVFDGWYLNDTNEVFDFNNSIKGKTTIKAHWKAIK